RAPCETSRAATRRSYAGTQPPSRRVRGCRQRRARGVDRTSALENTGNRPADRSEDPFDRPGGALFERSLMNGASLGGDRVAALEILRVCGTAVNRFEVRDAAKLIR